MESRTLGDEIRETLNEFTKKDQKDKYLSELSCNQCIKAGQPYMYEYKNGNIGSSQYFDDITNFDTMGYTGACCDKKKNGSVYCPKPKMHETPDGEMRHSRDKDGKWLFHEIDPSRKPLSTNFDDMNVAIAACPTKRSVCGKKRHFLYDSLSAPVEFSVNLGPKLENNEEEAVAGYKKHFEIHADECHWLIQVKCGVPLLKVEANLPTIADYRKEIKMNERERFDGKTNTFIKKMELPYTDFDFLEDY